MSAESTHTAWLDSVGRWQEPVDPADYDALKPIGTRAPLREYCRELWERRHFIWADARAKSLGTQRGTFLGNTWLIVKPMLDSIVFFVIFGLLLQTSRGIPNFIGYLIIGVTLFPPMQRALAGGGGVIRGSKNLIRGFNFPRAAIPISYTIRCAIDMLPPLIAVVILIMVLPPHALPTVYWLLVPVVFVLQNLFDLGLTFVSARITTLVPDMRNVWPFFTQFWFYGSGVFFSYDRFIDHPFVLHLMDWNPGYLVLTMYRDALLYATFPSLEQWGILLMWCLGLPAIGFVFFWAKEESYAAEH